MLNLGDQVGIVACSNALARKDHHLLMDLTEALRGMGLTPVLSPYLFEQHSVFSGSGVQRAGALHDMYSNNEIKAIFDISGGDVANELLDELDFQLIQENPKPFFGYSDLTTIINAIYTKTKALSYLYQVRWLVGASKDRQMAAFANSLLRQEDDLYAVKWDFKRGSSCEGVVVGGNIRCFLKLAGTPYLPELTNTILFLESYSGGVAQMATCLNQLKQMGAFNSIAGLLLGTFTEMEETQQEPDIVELVLKVTEGLALPIAKTADIGHGHTSKCLIIGKHQAFSG
jgi:muramoyltetrapeptide carboxypeptidase LdcA involved in peptidoglycan recycling